MFHNNDEMFYDTVQRVANHFGMSYAAVEKDYFVTLLLHKICERNPDIVFKGGTSLSKCYKIINRFSEDIDLNLLGDKKPTEAERKALKRDIVESVSEIGLNIENIGDTRSRRDFNQYVISYPSQFLSNSIKKNIIVETAVFFRIYPIEKREASCYIQDYLEKINRYDLIEKFSLSKFEVNTQSLERTLIDKCFALADYYLSGKFEAHSRHIYDIFKLMEHILPDDNLMYLAEIVRKERQSNKTCISSQDDINLNDILSEIIDKKIYEDDYEKITRNILYNGENISYSKAIEGLQNIVNSGIFIREDKKIEKYKNSNKKQKRNQIEYGD